MRDAESSSAEFLIVQLLMNISLWPRGERDPIFPQVTVVFWVPFLFFYAFLKEVMFMGLVSPKVIKCVKGDHFQHNVQSAIRALAASKKSNTSGMNTSKANHVSKR
jgi:hypothetical protein